MRRHFITHPQYQVRFALTFARGVFISILAPFCALLGTLLLVANNSSILPQQKSNLLASLGHFIATFLWVGAVVLGVCGIIGFYMSYKFVGPIRRIENWLVQRLSTPTTATLKLRLKDEMSILIRHLNRIMDKS